MSPELKAILEAPPDPTGEVFKRAIRESSIELKDEYLSLVLAQHSQRRFVEDERQRHAERIEAAVVARRHRVFSWSLVVMIVTMIFAAIAAWPVIRSWFPTH